MRPTSPKAAVFVTQELRRPFYLSTGGMEQRRPVIYSASRERQLWADSADPTADFTGGRQPSFAATHRGRSASAEAGPSRCGHSGVRSYPRASRYILLGASGSIRDPIHDLLYLNDA